MKEIKDSRAELLIGPRRSQSLTHKSAYHQITGLFFRNFSQKKDWDLPVCSIKDFLGGYMVVVGGGWRVEGVVGVHPCIFSTIPLRVGIMSLPCLCGRVFERS